MRFEEEASSLLHTDSSTGIDLGMGKSTTKKGPISFQLPLVSVQGYLVLIWADWTQIPAELLLAFCFIKLI